MRESNHCFKAMTIVTGIRLPTEDEIDAIYEQLEEVRKQLGACQEDCKHKFELIEGLQAQKVSCPMNAECPGSPLMGQNSDLFA